ncbi:cytochrome P450 [Rhodococcus opacus]|uniref:cytochrome P450 n=1 Tax=Rhodococcus opacus TaxID=37919 RepID=UPI001C472F10|nr:cytochrome P450 [Rhodococcus opacus]MBV6756696.1 cytochrome P450 [Rhodococcus opacus]
MTTTEDRSASNDAPTRASLVSSADHWHTPLGPDGTPYAYFESLRDELEETRIGWSERHGGFWLVGGYEEATQILGNAEAFSNRQVTLPKYETGEFTLIMGEEDDPDHKRHRGVIASKFSPRKVQDYAAELRVLTNQLIDGFIGDGRTDIAASLADEIPAMLTAVLLGLPPEEGEKYRRWMDAVTHWQYSNPELSLQTTKEMQEYAANLIEERRQKPGDDVMSFLVGAETEDGPLTDEELIGYFTILLIGGIDNSTRFLATTFWRLAWDVELRRRLRAHPELMGSAVDELFRFYGPALGGRTVTQRVTIGDVTMEPGQMVMLWQPVINRDRKVFTFPDNLVIERSGNRHLSLSSGIHRCLGVHLARLEASIVISEVLRRIPEFELDRADKPEWTLGQVCGFRKVPIVFPVGVPENS